MSTLLGLFSHNELKVSRLYNRYAKKFRLHRTFWLEISKEEREHSLRIKKLDKELKWCLDPFEKNSYSFEIIAYVSSYIDQEMTNSRRRGMKASEAFDCALRLEQSMVENKSFEIFNPKIIKIRRLMAKINSETKDHIRRLKKEGRKTRG